MAHIEGEIFIHRSVEDVFDVVADERNETRYNPAMVEVEQITSGPIGAGTQFQAVSRSIGGTAEMTIEFTALERPRRLASTTRMSSMEIRGVLTFDPVAGGTRMRWSWDYHAARVLPADGSRDRPDGPAPGGGSLGGTQTLHGGQRRA